MFSILPTRLPELSHNVTTNPRIATTIAEITRGTRIAETLQRIRDGPPGRHGPAALVEHRGGERLIRAQPHECEDRELECLRLGRRGPSFIVRIHRRDARRPCVFCGQFTDRRRRVVGAHQPQRPADDLPCGEAVGADHQSERRQRRPRDAEAVALRVQVVGDVQLVELAVVEEQAAVPVVFLILENPKQPFLKKEPG